MIAGLETEIKLIVKDLEKVETRLQQMGAQVVQDRQYEENLRFDQQDSRLEQDNRLLRLRFDSKATLTYKGPSTFKDGVFIRAEHEITVSDHATTIKILEALGYSATAKYEKYRTTYEYQNCHIMLDELPIGSFVEIEGPDPDNLPVIVHELNLEIKSAIPKSYLELFNEFCHVNGLNQAMLTFEALRNVHVTPEILGVIPADRK